MTKVGLDELPVGIKIAGRNTNNLRYADDTTLMAESEVQLKSFLMWVKEESAKVGLKLNIKKTKIMASSPLTSGQIDGEEMEVVTDFIFLGSKITADEDCSQEIKRCLLLGRKAMANLDSILKSRDITQPTKVHIVKAMVFPVAMYGCESWTIRKAERQRIETFELWCWRRPLRVLWTARRSNQSVLEEIIPDCSLEGQILKMKLKYFGHLMRRKDSLEKSLMLGTIDGKRRGWQRMRWLDGVTEAVGMSLSGLWGWRRTGRPGGIQIRRGAIVSEPAIQVRRKGKGTQVWTIEKLENKLIDMRDLYQEWKERAHEIKRLTGKRGDPFYEAQENHNLIGVANVFLECLFCDVKLQYAVPIISQQGEVAGRLHVEVMRVTGVVPERVAEGDDSSENSSESGSLEIMDNNGDIIHRPKKLTCRVSAIQCVH
ncbi:Kinesin-like protein KIF13A [Varanus komodoensis]|nr:Kinesin-like protein KIF13A [Varanus komodoensis]